MQEASNSDQALGFNTSDGPLLSLSFRPVFGEVLIVNCICVRLSYVKLKTRQIKIKIQMWQKSCVFLISILTGEFTGSLTNEPPDPSTQRPCALRLDNMRNMPLYLIKWQ